MAKKIGVVCVTYRNPEKPSIVREFGLVSLVEEMFSQDYKGDITLSVVDSSPQAHPYLTIVAQKYPEKLIYTHIPNRQLAPEQSCDEKFIPSNRTLKESLALQYYQLKEEGTPIPEALTNLILINDFNDADQNDYDILIGRTESSSYASVEAQKRTEDKYPIADIKNDESLFWKARVQEMMDIAGFVPFEDDYPIQTNIFSQIFNSRPTIGMKKNYGIQALTDSVGAPDVIVFSDDDDHHAPNYISKTVTALGNADFTRMTRYITHIFNASTENKDHAWGVFDLRVKKDANNFWRLDPQQNNETMHNLFPDGKIHDSKVGKKFSRLVTMAWPILSHEGALHTYSYSAWKKGVKEFGGCAPVSFAEDIILYRKFKDTFGKEFLDVHTPINDGDESFIRIADGGNASVIEWMEQNKNVPAWAQKCTNDIYELKDMKPDALHKNLTKRAQKLIL